MSNKLIALFALVPVWLMFVLGFLEGFLLVELVGYQLETFVGTLIIINVTWASVRLYRTED